MGSLDKSVDGLLAKMRSVGGTGKGSVGEQAVIKICEEFYQAEGGILIHSYSYKADPALKGNIKRNEDGSFFVERVGDTTEIDVLYVSKFRIFPIEVKAYRAKEIRLDDKGIYGCYKTDKSPVHQNEMHCRHLYPYIFRALPNGMTDYICPIVCFVDKAKLIDERTNWQKEYIKACTTDTLRDTIIRNNAPLGFQLNLQLVDAILKEAMDTSEKYFPPRL